MTQRLTTAQASRLVMFLRGEMWRRCCSSWSHHTGDACGRIGREDGVSDDAVMKGTPLRVNGV